MPAGAVAPVDHGVVEAGAVGVPPAAEDVAVQGEVVVDDVEVTGGGEVVEGVVDPSGAEGVGGGAVLRVLEAVALG